MTQSDRVPSQSARPSWGLLPNEVRTLLADREWNKIKHLKARLKADRPFPIEVPLKPPNGNQILEDINHFQAFICAWQSFPRSELTDKGASIRIIWEARGARHFSTQEMPIKCVINEMAGLAKFLGQKYEQQLKHWQTNISMIIDGLPADVSAHKHGLFEVLVEHLESVAAFNPADLKLLVDLIPQLHSGMGAGGYLRALPVKHVDTKFVEQHVKLLESIIDSIHQEDLKAIGLLKWLDCKDKPKDWLLVRPLCEMVKIKMGGIPLLRLSTDTLMHYELPADNILVIENDQACLSLPKFENTVAVAGGGRNVAWMNAIWLKGKHVAYWGDIDSEGFGILSDARGKLSSLSPIMMDAKTVEAYQERMVQEPSSVFKEPAGLTEPELELFRALRSGYYGCARLEQERLALDYIEREIKIWLGCAEGSLCSW